MGESYGFTGLELEALRRADTEWAGASASVREAAILVGQLVVTQKSRSEDLEALVERLDDASGDNAARLALLQENLRETEAFREQADAAVTTAAGFVTQVQNAVQAAGVLRTQIQSAINDLEPTIRTVVVEVIREELDLDPPEGETSTFTTEVEAALTPAQIRTRVNAAVELLINQRRGELNRRVSASIRRAVADQVVVPDDPDVDATVATIAASAATGYYQSQSSGFRSRERGRQGGVRSGRTNQLNNVRSSLNTYNAGFYVRLDGTGLEQRWANVLRDGLAVISDWFTPRHDTLRQLSVFLNSMISFTGLVRDQIETYEYLEDIPSFHPAGGQVNNIGQVVAGSLLFNVEPPRNNRGALIGALLITGVIATIATLASPAVFFGQGFTTTLPTGLSGSYVATIGSPLAALGGVGAGTTFTINTGLVFLQVDIAIGVAGTASAAAGLATTLAATAGLAASFGTSLEDAVADRQLMDIYGTSDRSAIERQADTARTGRGYYMYMVESVNLFTNQGRLTDRIIPYREAFGGRTGQPNPQFRFDDGTEA